MHLARFLALAALVCGSFLAGCGDSGTPAKPGPARNAGAPISSTRRNALLEDARSAFRSSAGRPIAERTQTMAQWVKGRPEFEAAGSETDRSVWLRFSDGRILVLEDPGKPGEPGVRGDAPAEPPSQPTAYPPNFELPDSNRYAILDSPALDRPLWYLPPQARKWLEASGYVDAGGGAEIAQLKRLEDVGVFYIDTHGCVGEDRDGRKVFGMVTASKVTPADDEALEGDFAAGRLIYFGLSKDWYGITGAFVRQYMTFSPGALVFLNTCRSADEAFLAACFEKGAGAYLGWKPPVYDPQAFRAATFLFDRLTGANEFLAETPPQRPFNLGAIYAHLLQSKYGYAAPGEHERTPDSSNLEDWTRGGKALVPSHPRPVDLQLRYGPKGTDVLRPVIALMMMDELEETLHVHGFFGGTPGRVTVRGKEVPVKSWARDLVKCALPRTGEGSAGPVVVEAKGRKSIAMPVTEWRGKLRYTEEDRSNGDPLTKSATLSFHLRAVLQPYRTMAGEEPRLYEDVVSATDVRFTTVVMPARDSSIGWEFSGTARTPNVTYTLTGSGSSPVVGPDGVPVVTSTGRIDTRRMTIFDFGLASSFEAGVLTSTVSTGDVRRDPALLLLRIDGAVLTLDERFGIKAGRHEQNDGTVTRRLEWEAIPAEHPPSATGPY